MGMIFLLVLAVALGVEARLAASIEDPQTQGAGVRRLKAMSGLMLAIVCGIVVLGSRADDKGVLLGFIIGVLPVVALVRRQVWDEAALSALRRRPDGLAAVWIVQSTEVLLYWLIGVGLMLVSVTILSTRWLVLRQPLVQALVQAIFAWVWAYWLCRRAAARLVFHPDSEVFARRPPSKRGAMVLGLVWGIVAAAIAAWFVSARPAAPATPMQNMIQTNESGLALFLFILAAIAVAPFFEEWIFRGYLYGLVQRLWGPGRAVVVVGLVFALLHVPQYTGDALAVTVVTVFGFGLTWLRYRFGSVRPCIGAHVMFNLGMVILPVVFFITRYPEYTSYKTDETRLSLQERKERLERIVSRHPNLMVAVHDLAVTSVALKDWDAAIRWTREGLKRQPQAASFRLLQGEILAAQGCYAQAVTVYEKLLQEQVLSLEGQNRLKEWRAAMKESSAETRHQMAGSCDHLFWFTKTAD